MGICPSCCGRRDRSPERDPLLPQHVGDGDVLPPPQTQLDKLADVLAAVKAGKLPSQEQLNRALRLSLQSAVLVPEGSSDGAGYGALSESGQQVLGDVRALLEAALEIGLEKNDDDSVQDLVYHTRKISDTPVQADLAIRLNDQNPFTDDIDTVAEALPTANELSDDAGTLAISVRNLAGLILTSSTFRLLLGDLLLASREAVADVAAQVGHAAAQVQVVAQGLEETARPAGGSLDDLGAKAAGAVEEMSQVQEETRDRWERLAQESPERVRESVVGRIQNVVNRAQQTPTYRRSLLAIMSLLHKYASKVSTLSTTLSSAPTASASALADSPPITITPVLWTDPHLARALADLKSLIERFARGQSLDPLLRLLFAVTRDTIAAPADVEQGTRALVKAAATWLDRALREPGWATSPRGTREVEGLYDRARAIFAPAGGARSQSKWGADVRALLAQTDVLLAALASDRSTSRLLRALDALSADTARFRDAAVGTGAREAPRAVRRWKRDIQRDIVGWVLPRVLRIFRALPMPRVEFASPSVDAAVDALLITAPVSPGKAARASASLLPDRVVVTSWSEIALDVVRADGEGRIVSTPVHPSHTSASGSGIARALGTGMGDVRTTTALRVSVTGLRIAAHDIGYYARYKGPGPLGYEDEGLLSVDIGRAGVADEGLSVEVEVEFDTDTEAARVTSSGRDAADADVEPKPLFRVRDVKVDVPGLRFSIARSKHWLVNTLLLQPLVAPLGRIAARYVIAAQLRGVLEGLARAGAGVKSEADRKSAARRKREGEGAGPGVEEWWEALVEQFGGGPDEDGANDDDDDEEPEYGTASVTETHTRPTLKGVIIETVTHPEPSSSELQSQPKTTTQLAIGIGAQILPGKGGAHDAHDKVDGPAQVARETLDDMQGKIDEVVDRAGAAAEAVDERAAGLREDIDRAEARGTVRARVEGRRKGWRSRAFDL